MDVASEAVVMPTCAARVCVDDGMWLQNTVYPRWRTCWPVQDSDLALWTHFWMSGPAQHGNCCCGRQLNVSAGALQSAVQRAAEMHAGGDEGANLSNPSLSFSVGDPVAACSALCGRAGSTAGGLTVCDIHQCPVCDTEFHTIVGVMTLRWRMGCYLLPRRNRRRW